MGEIDSYSKWDLKNNCWCEDIEYNVRGRAFAFAKYEKIIHNETEGFDYLIFAYGTRVENCSKDFVNVRRTYAGMDKVISYFNKSNKNIVIELFLMDADAPIVEDAKKVAQYIDSLSSLSYVNSINFIGLSKCGAMAFNVPKYFNKLSSFEKSNIYTVATPFAGTKLASPGIFYPEIERFIISKLGKNKVSKMIYNSLISYYEGISSNSHMDYDIAMLGGIAGDSLKLYDDSLIKNMFSQSNITAVSKIANYRNLVTGIDDSTLGEAIRNMDFAGIGLCFLNELFFDGKSDGMVETMSQRKVDSVLDMHNFRSDILISSHHCVSSNDRVLNDMLHIVDDTIDEYTDRNEWKTRRRILK